MIDKQNLSLHSVEDADAYNANSVEELAWAIEASQGEFALILARCNYSALRQAMVAWLHANCSIKIHELVLKESVKTLYTTIQEELGDEQPDALMVFGLETVTDIDQVLTATNQVREEFRKTYPFPLVLWINDEILKKLIRLAPDFENWATTTEFVLATSQLVEAFRQREAYLFNSILAAGGEHFLSNEAIFGPFYRRELMAALRDLRSRKQALESTLEASLQQEASLQFVFGRADYAKDLIDTALNRYRRSLTYWQRHHQLERQGVVLFHMGLCYVRQADLNRVESYRHLKSGRKYFLQCLDAFEQAQRPDLVAQFINQLGEVLQRLEAWDDLHNLAHKALALHGTYGDAGKQAQAYGFLADVALQKSRWQEARQSAQKALDILAELPNEQQQQQNLYLLLLAQAQQQLGQDAQALVNLHKVKELGPQQHPFVYIRVLEELRSLYFKQQQYLEAFQVKLEHHSIEQQYGLRAFIGASRLKPQRRTASALAESQSQETVAQEIVAAGRQRDLNRLVERLSSTRHKLTVIYGLSGVGKSSLVEAGLVPALKQKAIDTRDVLPVRIRVYTDWVRVIGHNLTCAIAELNVANFNLDEENYWQPATLLEQFQQHEQHHLLTVLIFDQFEEFFFANKHPTARKQFFEFFRDCLNIPFLKVVLSLREDYLHLLLQGVRQVHMDAIDNNILDKDILYYVGNFSPEAAKSIILTLTQRSHCCLEPALVDQLVQELAMELGEVRPIELQIVGAQLQTDGISTLAQYRERGTKAQLVQRYLEEVVADCGPENQRAAELVLYLLTDENNTRPLKTRAELEGDLKALAEDLEIEAEKLDLALKIFVESGLVVLLHEISDDRYQLVHDYLAWFIRQQKGEQLLEELESERSKRQRTEAKLARLLKQQLRIERRAAILLTICVVAIGALAPVGAMAWLSMRNGQQAVDDVAAQLRHEVSARIEQKLTTFLNTPHLVNQINADAIRLGSLNTKDTRSLERYFWHQMQQFDTVSYIAVGTENGEFVGNERLSDRSIQIVSLDKTNGSNVQGWGTDTSGNRTKLLRNRFNYNHRSRPWYKAAVKAGKPVWADIYQYYATQDLAISANQPVYDNQHQLIGVASADVSLSQVSEFLSRLPIGRTGKTFIIERSGLLIGTSSLEKPFRNYRGELERLKAVDSSNPLIRAAAQHLVDRFGSLTTINKSQELAFKLNGEQQFLQVVPFQDRRGINWLVVIVVPESDFMGRIEHNTRCSILIILGTFLGVSVLGVVVFRWLSK